MLVLATLPRAEGRGKGPVIRAYFSPKGGVLDAVVNEIRRSNRRLDVGLYMLTAPKLAWEIVAAHQRGVEVRVILDERMTERWSELKTLKKHKVPTWLFHLKQGRNAPSPPQFHHKFAVVDGETVITGSFNWTVTADQRNHENLLVVRDKDLATKYTEAFEKALKLAGERE
ncbi:MAG: phospholipase D-like domain-containing protein [Planctomycetota bacterium]